MTDNPKALVDDDRELRSDAATMRSLESPSVPEVLGARLAELLAEGKPTTVVVWDSPASVVLGHVVARELSAELVHAFADEGILGLTTELESGTSVAIVSYEWAEYPGLDAMVNLLNSRGTSVVGIGSVTAPAAGRNPNDLPVVSLVNTDQEPR